MVQIRLDRNLSRKVAEEFGPEITRREARRVMARAKAIANAEAVGRNPGHSVADRIEFGIKYHGIDTTVGMTVIGRDGSDVTLAHEFGAVNEQAGRFVEGHHVMQQAAAASGR